MADFSVSVPLGNKTDQKLSSPFLIKKTCILFSKTCLLIHDMKHERVEIKLYNLDTFKKQIDVNFIDLDSELVDLNYKVESLMFCHFWRSILSNTYSPLSLTSTWGQLLNPIMQHLPLDTVGPPRMFSFTINTRRQCACDKRRFSGRLTRQGRKRKNSSAVLL